MTATKQTSSNSSKWDTISLAVRIGGVALLALGIVGFLCLSGKSITVEQIILIVVAIAGVAGLAVPRGSSGGGRGAAAGGVLLVLSALFGGCACFQAAQALSRVETAEDVAAAMPLIMECSEDAAQALGQCRAGSDVFEVIDGVE
jgi:hypothetical protein